MAQQTVLITGANRGIGLGLAGIYLSRPSTTLIAAVRDPQHATVAALQDLPHGSSSKLVVVKIDSKKLDDASIAVDTLKAQGIHALDVVIANAGLSAIFPTVAELNPAHLVEHHLVNVVGPLMLFQAVRPLLLASKNGNAKFVAMGSQAGVQTNMPVIFDLFPRGGNNAAYGPSKTALNFLMQEAHHENKDLTVFVVDPGFVRTEMGNSAADMFGISLERGDFSSVSVEETTTGLVKIIDEATRETIGGKFRSHDGTALPW